jgi:hypothetical protein
MCFLVINFFLDIWAYTTGTYINIVSYILGIVGVSYLIWSFIVLKNNAKDKWKLCLSILPFLIFIPIIISGFIFTKQSPINYYVNIYTYIISIITIILCIYYLVKNKNVT